MKLKDFAKERAMEEADSSSASDISVDRLMDQGLVALQREMKNILVMSARGKLDPATARDLRDHVKLLFELQERQNNALKEMTDEQLKKRAKDVLEEPTDVRIQDRDPS